MKEQINDEEEQGDRAREKELELGIKEFVTGLAQKNMDGDDKKGREKIGIEH